MKFLHNICGCFKQQPEQKQNDCGKLGNAGDVSRFRRIFPQVLACLAKNLLLFEFGLSMAFPTILIPALSGLNEKYEISENLLVTPTTATWLASITLIAQPLGSILSGLITEPLGRKRAMLLVNIPHAFSWLSLYYTESLALIYVAFCLQGIGIGLMEAPIFTYLGEITEATTRGPLTAITGFFITSAIMLIYWLNTILSWRQLALICTAVPVIATLAILLVPETPIWLLSKGRTDDALKALQWLRGWTANEKITTEFKTLQEYQKNAHKCYACEKQQQNCPHPTPSFQEKLHDFMRRRTFTPFLLLATQFVLMQLCGLFPMRPYSIQILKTFNTSVSAEVVNSLMPTISILANILILLTIHKFGKRRMYLYSSIGVMLCCFALSFYGFHYLPTGINSFEQYRNHSASTIISDNGNGYIPVMLFLILQFVTTAGVGSVANMMLSELFPFKSRALATGLTASTYYIAGFIGTKSYYTLETTLSLPGVLCYYGFAALVGFIVMYLVLPETENRTLEEIELYFSDKNRKVFDVVIKKKISTND